MKTKTTQDKTKLWTTYVTKRGNAGPGVQNSAAQNPHWNKVLGYATHP